MKRQFIIFLLAATTVLTTQAYEGRFEYTYPTYQPPRVESPATGPRPGKLPTQQELESADRERIVDGQRDQNRKIQGALDSTQLELVEKLRSYHRKTIVSSDKTPAPMLRTPDVQRTAIRAAEAAAAGSDFATLARIVSDFESPLLQSVSPETKKWLETSVVPRALRESRGIVQSRLPGFKEPGLQQERVFTGHMLEAVAASRPVLSSVKVATWMRASVSLLHSAAKWETQGRSDLAAENLRMSRAIATFLAGDDEGFGIQVIGTSATTFAFVHSGDVLTSDTYLEASPDAVGLASLNALTAPLTIGLLASRPDYLYEAYGVTKDRLFKVFDDFYQKLPPHYQDRLKALRDGALEVALGLNPVASFIVSVVPAVTGYNLAGAPVTDIERAEAWVSVLSGGFSKIQAFKDSTNALRDLDPANAKRGDSIFQLLIGTKADTDFLFELKSSDPSLSGVTFTEYYEAVRLRATEGARRAQSLGIDAVLTGARTLPNEVENRGVTAGSNQMFTYMVRTTPSEVLGVRFHAGTDPGGVLFLPAKEVDGLSLDEIAKKFALSRNEMLSISPMIIQRGDVIAVPKESGQRLSIRRYGKHELQGSSVKLNLGRGERIDLKKVFSASK